MSGPRMDVRSRLLDHFKSTEDSQQGGKWDELWKEGFSPWDQGSPNPALVDLLQDRHDLLGQSFVVTPGGRRRKRALVPGCGKGYDVLLLAAFGYDAYGLEISEKALEEAKENQIKKEDDIEYKVRDTAVGKGSVNWLSGDFFKGDFMKMIEGDGTFDLLYDYTFLSALPPSLRPAWSRGFNQLLSTNGRLVCVEFPTYKPHNTGGPPWALPPKVYLGHLPRPGEELPYDKTEGLLVEKLEQPAADGLQRIAHFQPKRTHDAGISEDGRVLDWVGVWGHSS